MTGSNFHKTCIAHELSRGDYIVRNERSPMRHHGRIIHRAGDSACSLQNINAWKVASEILCHMPYRMIENERFYSRWHSLVYLRRWFLGIRRPQPADD